MWEKMRKVGDFTGKYIIKLLYIRYQKKRKSKKNYKKF